VAFPTRFDTFVLFHFSSAFLAEFNFQSSDCVVVSFMMPQQAAAIFYVEDVVDCLFLDDTRFCQLLLHVTLSVYNNLLHFAG